MTRYLLIGLFSLFCHSVFTQTAALTLRIGNVKIIEKSKIMVAIYNSEETFFEADKIFADAIIPVDSTVVVHVFPDMPVGEYAVTIYHDEDNDDEMDRKWYGPPKEGYAFSNNFSSNLRPPRYDDTMFKLEDDTTLDIVMVY